MISWVEPLVSPWLSRMRIAWLTRLPGRMFLQLLVDLAEADIQKLDAKLRHEQDSATLLGREKSHLQEEVGRGTGAKEKV